MKKGLLTSALSIVICLLSFAQSNQKTVVYLKSQPKIETLSSLVDSLTFVVQKATPKARGIIMHQTNAKKTIFAASNVDSIRVVEPNSLVITQSIADITTTSVNCKGIVSPTISSTIYARGFVWSKTTNPTYEVNLGKTTNGTQTGEYSATITGLTAGSRYYIKAYAVTGTATLYGDEISFIPGLLPTVTTNGVSTVFSTTAIGGLSIVNGGSPIMASGLVWGKQNDPTIESNLGMTISNSVSSSVTGGLSSLAPMNDYYVRGYASNYFGVSYGNSLAFSTTLYPEVTNTISEISVNSAKSNNTIATGGLPVLARGVVWSKVTTPTLTSNLGKTDDGIGDGTFVSTLNDLSGNTTYYIRTFATISTGTTYSVEQTFKTLPIPATLTTSAATTIKATTAVVGGNITSDGGASITERGVCWSTNATPSITDSKLQSGSGIGSFSFGITGLVNNTTYYARAYAINSTGTSYGTTINFKTLDGIALMTTAAATTITALSTTIGGNITSDGGATITERGVCWSTTSGPTISNSKATSGSGTGSFTVSATGLINNTTYYVRAYATNAVGTSYGNEVSFKTLDGIALMTTVTATSVTALSATLGVSISSDGGATITERGVCWSTTSGPTITNSKATSGSGTGSYTVSATGLVNNTTYYVRAYATNSVGTTYGGETSFKTFSGSGTFNIPTVTNITINSASLSSSITDDGGAAITVRGVCWNTSSNPTISNSKVANGSGLGPYSVSATGLINNTTYYVRAYATSSIGTSYGNEVSFKTLSGIASMTTTAATSITAVSATLGGSITSDGGATITERGVCWSSTPSPTIINSKVISGSGLGSYTVSVTGLINNTTYYARAYAISSIGASYGSEITFSTSSGLISLTTSSITSVNATSALLGGNVLSDGDAPITARGVCWSTSSNPTINLSTKTVDGNGLGSFVSKMIGLSVGSTYYVRAYATNSIGTVYGNEISFSTNLASLTTTAVSSITATTATGGGNISNIGGSSVSARGICWGQSTSPTISDSITNNGNGIGVYSSTLNGLSPGKTYYVRSYATNSIGTAYGNEVNFTTPTILPSVKTIFVSNTSNSARIACNITADGGANVTSRGVCWSTSSNPTISSSIISEGSGLGPITSSITGLTPETKYFARAYATNSIGTAYGDEVIFSTIAIGQLYQGGVVAYILKPADPGYIPNEVHGLIACAYDISSSCKWGGYNQQQVQSIVGTSTLIGAGQNNTDLIVGVLGAGSYAARLCYDLNYGGYSDWYLPSIKELQVMISNKTLIGGFSEAYYWSSSFDMVNGLPYSVLLSENIQRSSNRDNYFNVRPMRSF